MTSTRALHALSYCCMTFSLMQLCSWLHIMTAQNKTQKFKPTHMHKYPPLPSHPPSNTKWKLRQTHETRTVLCSGSDFEGMLRCGLLSLTHGKNTQQTFIEALLFAKKLIHSLSVSLASLKHICILRHTWWLRGLRAFRAHLGLGLQWIMAMMWRMLSILICQRGLGTVLTDEWAGPGKGHSSLPSLSFLILRHPQRCSLPPLS